jgi:PAS domain S-box-containing protein
MKDENKTEEQLLSELSELRERITQFEYFQGEEKYKQFFRTSRDCVFITSKDGRWTYLNDAGVELFGYSNREELMELNVSDFYANPEERAKHINIIEEKGFAKEFPIDLLRKDGTVIHAIITSATRYDKENNMVGFQGTIRDITELKQMVEALRESEKKFRDYVEHAPDGIFVVDDTGRYCEINKSACRLTGYSKEEIEKMSIRELLAEESLEDGLAHYKKLIETGAATSDLWHKHKDGSKRCLTVDAVKISETRVLGFCKDITSRKLAEEELKQTLEKLRKSLIGAIQVLSLTLETRDPYTAGHQKRVSSLARAIAQEMAYPRIL